MLGRQLRTCGCNGVIPVSRSSASVEFMGLWVILRPFGLSEHVKASCAGQCSTKKGCFLPFQMLSPRFPRPGRSRAGRQGGKSGRQGALGVTATPHPCVTSGKLLPLSGPLIFTRKIKGLAGFEFKSGKLEAGRPNAAIYLCVWGNATFNLRGFK